MLRAHTRKDNPVIRNLFKFERKHKKRATERRQPVLPDRSGSGKKYILDQTVISVKGNELYSVRFENDVWVNNTTYTFKSGPDGTLIRAEVIVEGKGIIMKSIFTLMKRMFNAGLQTSLNILRITFEQYE